jgi:hypothetical protein
MKVARIETENGSHIEPPLDQTWDNLTKLRWHAAVVMEDTGYLVDIEIEESDYSTRTLGVWVRNRGYYDIRIAGTVSGPHSFDGAWDYLTGVSAGIIAADRARGDA